MTLDDDDLILLVVALMALKEKAGAGAIGKYMEHKCDDMAKRLKQYQQDRRNGDV